MCAHKYTVENHIYYVSWLVGLPLNFRTRYKQRGNKILLLYVALVSRSITITGFLDWFLELRSDKREEYKQYCLLQKGHNYPN